MAAKMDIAKVWARGNNEGFTPYMIATLINVELASKGLEEIRPQMMYNYDKNGLINGTKKQNADRGYTTEETIAFINKFVAMRQNKANGNSKVVEPQTVEDIDAQVARLLELKSELQGTLNA